MRGTTQWWSPYDIDWPPTLVMRGTTKWWSPYDREKEGALHIIKEENGNVSEIIQRIY